LKTHLGVLTLLAISVTLLIAGASTSLAAAQPPSACTAALSYPAIPVQYGEPNVPFVVPVSATCSAYYGTELYATGSAYDATSNTGLGTATTVLSSVNGGTQFSGQLGFNQFQTTPGDSIQISVSIYTGPGGNLLTATGETVQVGAGEAPPVQPIQQVATTTVTVGQYPYANPTPPSPPQNYQTQNPQRYQSRPFLSQGYSQRSNNPTFDYVVILAIIAAVIIATAGLVLVARVQRPQAVWYPVQTPPPS